MESQKRPRPDAASTCQSCCTQPRALRSTSMMVISPKAKWRARGDSQSGRHGAGAGCGRQCIRCCTGCSCGIGQQDEPEVKSRPLMVTIIMVYLLVSLSSLVCLSSNACKRGTQWRADQGQQCTRPLSVKAARSRERGRSKECMHSLCRLL